MNLPVDDAIHIAAMHAARRNGRTIIVKCDDYEVVGFENLPPVLVPIEPAWHIMADLLAEAAAIMRHKELLGEL